MIIYKTKLHMSEKAESHDTMPFILQSFLKNDPKQKFGLGDLNERGISFHYKCYANSSYFKS